MLISTNVEQVIGTRLAIANAKKRAERGEIDLDDTKTDPGTFNTRAIERYLKHAQQN